MSLNDLHPLWKYKIYREITREQRPQKPECPRCGHTLDEIEVNFNTKILFCPECGYRKEKEK